MANNRLPYGLCKKYHIDLPEGATPRDAWEALKETGIEYFDDSKDIIVDIAKVKETGASTPGADDGLDFTREVSLASLEWRLYYDELAMFKRRYGENALQNGDIPPIEIGDKIIVS